MNDQITGDTFGEYFFNAISSKNLTLGEVARKSNIPPNHLYDVRDGKKSLSVKNALKIQKNFKINARKLLHKQIDFKILDSDQTQIFNETEFYFKYDDLIIKIEIEPNDGHYSSANYKTVNNRNPDKVIRHQLNELNLSDAELLEYAKGTIMIRLYMDKKRDHITPNKLANQVNDEFQKLLKLREKAPFDYKQKLHDFFHKFMKE